MNRMQLELMMIGVISFGLSLVGLVLLAKSEQILLLVRSLGLWGPLLMMGLFGLISLTPIPTDPLVLILGGIYGLVWGVVLGCVGNTLAALVEYSIAEKLAENQQIGHGIRMLKKRIKPRAIQSPLFLIFGRMIPQFGGKLVSVSAGLYGVSRKKFILTALSANLIGAVVYAVSGSEILSFIRGL